MKMNDGTEAGVVSRNQSISNSNSLGKYVSITLAETYAIIDAYFELKNLNVQIKE